MMTTTMLAIEKSNKKVKKETRMETAQVIESIKSTLPLAALHPEAGYVENPAENKVQGLENRSDANLTVVTQTHEDTDSTQVTGSECDTEEAPLVLVAEDDEVSQILMRESLEIAGYRVEMVENGHEALSAYKRLQPDIVLMDVMMPKMDGISACYEIRNLPGGDLTPVLMVTTLEDKDSIRDCYEAGATDFMTKPVNWMVLQQRMRYMLRASRAVNDLCQSKVRLAEAQRIAQLGNWEWNVETNALVWSDETYRIFGLKPDEFKGTYDSLLMQIHPDDRDMFEQTIHATVEDGTVFNIDHRIILPDGSKRIVHHQAEAVRDMNGVTLLVAGTVQDISDRKRTEAKITYLAYHDSLTGLPNRNFFKQFLEKELLRAERHGKMVGLMFLDLDHFKHINDSFGHDAGDEILREAAKRISECIRGYDSTSRMGEMSPSSKHQVTRFGGDEFAVLLTDISRIEDTARAAKRILSKLSEPFVVKDHEVFIGASIGITLYPMGGRDVDTLLKNADIAMYHAKDTGRNNYQFFTKSMNRMAFERLTLETRLRKALENEEFRLYYQPQVDAKTGKIVGIEALIRWQQPELGLISPLEFIPIAEETGLIVPIGEWVIRKACEQNKAWQDAGYPPVRMAINLSSRQLRHKELVAVVSEALNESGLDPCWLELELTESTMMQVSENPLAILNRLRSTGVRLSIDDFGVGYSSLSHLKRFPVDNLKIDRSFVKDIPTDSDNIAIIKAVIAMAKGLKIKVTAEGVQTPEQLQFLQESGCDWMQGYYFSPPVPADEMTTILADG